MCVERPAMKAQFMEKQKFKTKLQLLSIKIVKGGLFSEDYFYLLPNQIKLFCTKSAILHQILLFVHQKNFLGPKISLLAPNLFTLRTISAFFVMVGTVAKCGKAITFYSGSEGMHLAITDYAPKDAKILVENKKNGKKIVAKVLGPMNKNSEEEAGLLILLSDTVKKELQPSGENFMVEISLINE